MFFGVTEWGQVLPAAVSWIELFVMSNRARRLSEASMM
jgi:hypothetical protein